MFKGFKCDSITVPACSEHNCAKGGQDQAIIAVLLTSIKNYSEKSTKHRLQLGRDVNIAIRKTKFLVSLYLDDMPEKLKAVTDLGFIKSQMNIKNWIKNLTAAIIYDGVKYYESGIDWDKTDAWQSGLY